MLTKQYMLQTQISCTSHQHNNMIADREWRMGRRNEHKGEEEDKKQERALQRSENKYAELRSMSTSASCTWGLKKTK